MDTKDTETLRVTPSVFLCVLPWQPIQCSSRVPWSSVFFRVASAVGGGLDAVQLGVMAAPLHQFLVSADFDESRAVEHHDQIGHARGRESVGLQDRDAPFGAAVARGG